MISSRDTLIFSDVLKKPDSKRNQFIKMWFPGFLDCSYDENESTFSENELDEYLLAIKGVTFKSNLTYMLVVGVFAVLPFLDNVRHTFLFGCFAFWCYRS